MTRTVASGFVRRLPRRNEFKLRSTGPNGLPATKPSLFVVVLRPAATPFSVVALIEQGVLAADVALS
jgi:hypothetical protein